MKHSQGKSLINKLTLLPSRIKQVRLSAGLTMEEFAKSIGVSKGTISLWESGKSLPSQTSLRLIAEIYNLNLDWLLTGKGDMGRTAPTTPPICERFKFVRQHLRLSQQEFAKKLGFSQSHIAEIENGKKEPSRNILSKLVSQFKINLNWLLTGEGSMYKLEGPEVAPYEGKLVNVNVYALAGAGGGIELIDPEPVDTIWLPEEWVKPHIVPVKIEGESMEPTLMNGAVVGVDREDRELVSGKIYAVWIDWEGSVIKRIFVEPDKLLLKSDNPAYPEAYIKKEDFRSELILGRVKWVWQRL